MSEWIEWKWTEEKPYPESFDTMVHVLYRDGTEGYIAKTVFYYRHNFRLEGDEFDITHYRLA